MGLISFLKEKFSKKKDNDVESYSEGMSKSRQNFSNRLNALSKKYKKVNQDYFEEELRNHIISSVNILVCISKIKEFFIKLFKSKRFYFFLAITALVVLLFYRNFPRFFISVKSFWHHLIYFVSYDFITDKTPPIQSFQYVIDEGLFELFLPVDWEIFKERFALSFELLIQPQIIRNYLSTLGNILYQASRFLYFFNGFESTGMDFSWNFCDFNITKKINPTNTKKIKNRLAW